MSLVEQQTPKTLKPAPITSVQPGGGFCVAVELAWGRLRRTWLRQFRPGYVRHMEEKRQGTCPSCPHDIIDPRDLKLYRNVCGYWFRPEDDAFRGRDRLGLARMGLVEIVLFSLLFFVVSSLLFVGTLTVSPFIWVVLVPILVLWAQIVAFFRDPERVATQDPVALVSPADGVVTHVEEVAEPDFRNGKALRISIFLSVFDVHVNRIPRTGKVVGLRYFPGDFLDARHPQCGVANEQLWVDLLDAGTGRQLRIKQISGKIARRIVCWLKMNEEVKYGERFGMIKFGSRTEIYLPADMAVDVLVRVGDTVRGGSTLLLRFKSSELVNR